MGYDLSATDALIVVDTIPALFFSRKKTLIESRGIFASGEPNFLQDIAVLSI